MPACCDDAGVAQLVERNLAKVEVESSRLFCRSSSRGGNRSRFPPHHISRGSPRSAARTPGGVAEWSCSGLQSRVRRFDSDPRLQSFLQNATAQMIRNVASLHTRAALLERKSDSADALIADLEARLRALEAAR